MFFKEMTTKRLRLKNIGYDDREFIFKEFSSKNVTKYLFDTEALKEKSEADKIIDMFLEDEPRGHHRWIIIRKEDSEKIGTCGVHKWNKSKKKCEIGYDMQEEFWGNGYMTEALKSVIEFAQTEMQVIKIEAHIYPENKASVKLAERLGFRDMGKRVNYNYHNKDLEHIIFELRTNKTS